MSGALTGDFPISLDLREGGRDGRDTGTLNSSEAPLIVVAPLSGKDVPGGGASPSP